MRFTITGVFILCCVCLSFAADQTRIQDVSRTPPAVYSTRLSPLLTPVDQALAERKNLAGGEDTGGANLLSESILYRDDDGVLYRVIHSVQHALDQSAVKSLGTDTVHFDQARESAFLVEAATILADGTRHPVDAKGAFIKTPQREADSALYSSNAELTIVFPNVAPGSSTESIVLVRENTPVMPGEFAASRSFSSGWPTRLRRVVVDLPSSEWSRMRTHVAISGVPVATTETYAAGRERHVWIRTATPALHWEESAPDFEFRAPTLWLTTLPDWDAIARWYHGLVSDRSTLGADLAQQVDQWTTGMTDRAAIIALLHEKVANEVRYTGLEFGLAGYQPYPCLDVWRNRYGDCKDKANLLRTMLAHKGIHAHLALLSTESLGRVEKASPSWHQFSHCIVAVEAAGGFLFCDPTVKHLPAGSLPPSDLARDVLVVRGTSAVWTRTPDKLDSFLNVRAELAMSADGELSGWLDIDATGSAAASYAEYFAGYDRDDLRRSLQRYSTQFFPGAEVVDTAFTAPAGSVRATKARAFIVRPARSATGQTLKFPFPADWLPDVDTTHKRIFPYAPVRREESMRVTIALPTGWTAGKLPPDFTAPSAAATFSAGWRIEDGKLIAELTWRPERSEIAPEDYAAFQQSIRALKAWLEQPALLAAADPASNTPPTSSSSSTNSTPASPAPDLAGFIIMPSGEGQLRLLDEKYPSGERDSQRRAALGKILQWFPDDPETVFTAKTHLALIDWNNDADKKFTDTMAALLAGYSGKLTSSTRSWGEFLEAKARWLTHQDPEAIKHLQSLAADTSINRYRRGWCAYQAGDFISRQDPAAAIAYLRTFENFETDTRPNTVKLIAACFARLGDDKGLHAWLDSFIATAGEETDELLAGAIDRIESEWTRVPDEARSRILVTLTTGDAALERLSATSGKIKSLNTHASLENARRAFTRNLRAWLEKNPPTWWTREKSPTYADTAALIRHLEERNNAADPHGTLDATLQLLLHHSPSYENFGKYTRWSLWWLDKKRFNDPLLDQLGRLSLELPSANTSEIVEVWDTYARHLANNGRSDQAREIRRRTFANTGIAEYQRVEAGGELGKIELAAGRVDEALAAFRQIEPMHTRLKKGVDYLLLSFLVTLERGEYDRALEIVARIGEQSEKLRDEAAYGVIIGHLVRAAKDPQNLKRFWQHTSPLAGEWRRILADHGTAPPLLSQPPVEDDFAAHKKRLDDALAAGKKADYLAALDTFARLARAVPLFINDYALQAIKTGKLGTALQRSLYDHLLHLVTNLDPIDPQFDIDGRLWEVATLGDLGQKEPAAIKAEKLYRELGVATPKGERALQLWILFARGSTTEPAALSEIASVLAGPQPLSDRLELVHLYSDSLLAHPDRADQQRQLLERETARPDFPPGPNERADILRSRLTQQKNKSASPREFTAALAQWKKNYTSSWTDCVMPATLDDPRVASLEQPAQPGQAGLTIAEAVKVNLLLAADESRPAGQREAAFSEAILTSGWATCDATTMRGICLDAARIESLGNRSRALIVARTIANLVEIELVDQIDPFLKAPAANGLTADYRSSAETIRKVIPRLAKRDGAWGAECIAQLTAAPIDILRDGAIRKTLIRLVNYGQSDEADRLLASTSTITLHPQFEKTAAAVRLDWTRSVRAAKNHQPFLAGLRDFVLKLPGASTAATQRVKNHLDLNSPGRLSSPERVELLVHLFHTGRASHELLWPMARLLRAVSLKHQPMLGPALLSQTLATAGDDGAKSAFLLLAANLCDIDRPDVLTNVQSTLTSFLASSASASQPATRDTVVHCLALTALRTSSDPRPAALFDLLDHTRISAPRRLALQASFHFSRGQDADCLLLLDKLNVDMLSDTLVYPAARIALERAGRADERKLLDDTVRVKIARQMSDLWLDPADAALISDTLVLALAAEASDLIPDTWVKHALVSLGDPLERTSLKLSIAFLRKDWPALYQTADDTIKLRPDGYESHFYRAIGGHRANRNTMVVADLRTFLDHCRDSKNCPEARALLAQLTSPQTAAR